MEQLEQIVGMVNAFLWNELLIILLVGTGLFYTVRLGFIQIRKFKAAAKILFGGMSFKGEAAGKSGTPGPPTTSSTWWRWTAALS